MTARLITMSEDQLQYTIIDLAKRLGLLVHHCRPAPVRQGKWITPIQGFKGFCDLVVAGPGGVVFRELKNDVLQPSPEQMTWLGTLEEGGADVAIWRPAHLHDGTIERELKRLAKPRETTLEKPND